MVSKAVSRDFPVVEDSIVQVLFTFFHKSNKKYELLKEQTDPTAQGRFKGLMSVACTRWLFYSGAISRALDILPSVAFTLDYISELPEFEATDRSTAAGLFLKLVCIEKINILIYLDYIFDKLAHLSVIFQSSTPATSDAICHTNRVICELHDGANPIAVKAVINDNLSLVIKDLEEVGIEIINYPVRRQVRSYQCEELLASMVAFTHHTGSAKRPRVASTLGSNETKLIEESTYFFEETL